jgi:two-component system, chemotaxis family, CheB/CheR fusion protein
MTPNLDPEQVIDPDPEQVIDPDPEQVIESPPSQPTIAKNQDISLSSETVSIVAIGASAGGLDACRKLFDAMPATKDMAFILVQHLDPKHDSMMADLLATHTSMTVQQARDGMPIKGNNLYIIPPGHYLSIARGALHISKPEADHNIRLPFDFLLHSLANECGARTICVVLSGTGGDGSSGLKTLKEKGGFIIAQDPNEAGYDGMPRSAIATGAVDMVLTVKDIPAALVNHSQQAAMVSTSTNLALEESSQDDSSRDWVQEIIALLKKNTPHDFTLYKRETLKRRIERRSAMAGIDDMGKYLTHLQSDSHELNLLGKDLLIHVTKFFRDPSVFRFLADKIIPELVQKQPPEQPIRVWITGCSTGEETYSLAMLFQEQITAEKYKGKLQVFASDIDADAVAIARTGLYTNTIEADVSPERLQRFFSKETGGYKISPELRSTVVFTVHDVLADPPFSRLDLIACRNLFIYLRPEAKAKALSMFHFALREGGILLLGSSETVGQADDCFEAISASERVYRNIGRSRLNQLSFSLFSGQKMQGEPRFERRSALSRQMALADLCQRMVMANYAPAAVLANRKYECLYTLGPVNRYLSIPSGHVTQDLLTMISEGTQARLRSAIQQVYKDKKHIVITDCRLNQQNGEDAGWFRIELGPVSHEGEDLLLICFVDNPKPEPQSVTPTSHVPEIAALEQELEATKSELQNAIKNLAISTEEQKAINEEAMSVSEEYQSTNEELVTSKEELQSLNEEMNALNTQLQETLERQKTTSNDLQNILYSTNVATLFLDSDLNIRFFTPATRFLFKVIPSDVGRPLKDLHSLALDNTLTEDAMEVLSSLTSSEREIEAEDGVWFNRRISPYRTQDMDVDGVVITFNNITVMKNAVKELEEAKQQADEANAAKSRFLAAASHDLRQPLQAIALLQGLLAKTVQGERAQQLVARLEQISVSMSAMLDTLLNINQIESGILCAEKVMFWLDEMFIRVQNEFVNQAMAQGIEFRVIPARIQIFTDPHLLEQMIRNLLTNAFKYTRHGKVLMGCRRRQGILSIEVWDTGIGIPENDFERIFEEYQQIDNTARERSRGLGLGLSIVRRVGKLLEHSVKVRSQVGKGSVFSIEIKMPTERVSKTEREQPQTPTVVDNNLMHKGTILVVDDDPGVRDLLEMFLQDEGHSTVVAADGVIALASVKDMKIPLDLIIADYNLPSGLNGVQLILKLRKTLQRDIPAIILTGDIVTSQLQADPLEPCVRMGKPMRLAEITRVIQQMLSLPDGSVSSRNPS